MANLGKILGFTSGRDKISTWEASSFQNLLTLCKVGSCRIGIEGNFLVSKNFVPQSWLVFLFEFFCLDSSFASEAFTVELQNAVDSNRQKQ